MDEIIKQLRNKYKEISDNLYEDNVRDHIIINTFMKIYGYTEYTLGEPVIKGFCDIFIPIDEKRAFIIEVKRGIRKLRMMIFGRYKPMLQVRDKDFH